MLDEFRTFMPSATFIELAYRAVERLDADTIRMRSGEGTKQLIEEVLPIAAFVKYLEIPSRRIQCKLTTPNDDHDAEIKMEGKEVDWGYFEPAYNLEVTGAASDKDYLEREALTRYGGVFGGGDIHQEGSKHRGDYRIVSKAKAVDGTQPVTNASKWISDRLAAKRKKNYPQPCLLLVNVYPEKNFSIHEWAAVAREVRRGDGETKFAAEYIVDWSTNTVFAF